MDRPVTASLLTDALTVATGVAPDCVRVIRREDFERSPEPWFHDWVTVGIQISEFRGDFPLEVELISRVELDVRDLLTNVARELDVAILTDELDVNPLSDAEWLMITPDGSSTPVLADPDEFGRDEPAIILEPESRAIYDAKRAHPVAVTR